MASANEMASEAAACAGTCSDGRSARPRGEAPGRAAAGAIEAGYIFDTELAPLLVTQTLAPSKAIPSGYRPEA